MHKHAANLAVLAVVLSAAFAARAEDADQPKSTYFEHAKITVNERAHADGFLRVRVQPRNQDAREATLIVPKHMSENKIAKGLAEALGPALGDDYKVDRDAGEHVKIKKAKRTAPDFAVEITFSAPGFSIILDD